MGIPSRLGDWLTRAWEAIVATFLGWARALLVFVVRFFARIWRAIATSVRSRKFWWSVAVGVGIEIGLHAAGGSPLVTSARNWALDSVMRIKAGLTGEPDPRVPSLAFVDVDEETWRDPLWDGGEPLRAPRDLLFDLVRIALDKRARYVIVDVAIEDKPEIDGIFKDGITHLLQGLEENNQHLLFVRTLRAPLGSHPKLAPEWRPSVLDALEETSNRIHSVAPYFRLSPDGIARDWMLWQAGCRRMVGETRGKWRVLPSAQIVIAALQRTALDLQEQPLPWKAAELGPPCIVSAEALPASDLESTAIVAEHLNHELLRGFRELGVLDDHPEHSKQGEDEPIWFSNRVFFTLPFPPRPDQATHISALDLLGPHPRTDLDFREGVVVVGQSFEAARDSYTTPIGAMPGSFLILNGIKSMISPGQLYEQSKIPDRLMSVLMILLVSLLYETLGTFAGTFVISLTLAPGLIFLSVRLINYGCWVDFAVPLLGIALDRVFDAIKSMARKDCTHWFSASAGMHEAAQPDHQAPAKHAVAGDSPSPKEPAITDLPPVPERSAVADGPTPQEKKS